MHRLLLVPLSLSPSRSRSPGPRSHSTTATQTALWPAGLTAGEVVGVTEGRGMGFARPAELNR